MFIRGVLDQISWMRQESDVNENIVVDSKITTKSLYIELKTEDCTRYRNKKVKVIKSRVWVKL